eukprot:gene11195-23385_t
MQNSNGVDANRNNLEKPKIDKTVIQEGSVHLKLTQQFDHTQAFPDASENTNTSVLEYVNNVNNGTILAFIGSNRTILEIFSIHMLDRNLTEDPSVYLREKIVDLKDKDIANSLLDLWKKERLISSSRDPLEIIRDKQSFYETLMSHTNKIQILRNDTMSDIDIVAFMNGRNISGKPWTAYFYDDKQHMNVTLSNLKSIAQWFRSEFPYFYDTCEKCGNNAGNEFIGYVFPSPQERSHLAGRTELYHCGCDSCKAQFRFPRYNAMSKVLLTKKGRCGEYSILMMYLLRNMGYTARWVVDWADHSFNEVCVDTVNGGNKWIHLDPCEAAVDEPLIYQSWGKNQTYILAFTDDHVEDVTIRYTTDFISAEKRREVSSLEFDRAIAEARAILVRTKRKPVVEITGIEASPRRFFTQRNYWYNELKPRQEGPLRNGIIGVVINNVNMAAMHPTFIILPIPSLQPIKQWVDNKTFNVGKQLYRTINVAKFT